VKHNDNSATGIARTEWQGVLAHVMILAMTVLLGMVLIGPLATWMRGTAGFWSAGAAGATCLAATVGAALIGRLLCRLSNPVSGVLAGMLLRMALPLAACMIVQSMGGFLAHAGFVYWILLFYLPVLAVETVIAVRDLGASNNSVGM